MFALKPSSSIEILPFSISKPLRRPFVIRGEPVVRVTLGVFINPAPFILIPFGLATMTSALFPATSVKPFRRVLDVPVTSFRMSFALAPFRFGLYEI